MKGSRLTVQAVFLSLAAASAGAQPPPRCRRRFAPPSRRRVQEIAARVDGVVGYTILDLTTGERIAHLERETFPTASAIKLAIVYELFKQAAEHRINLDETIDPRSPPGGRRHRRARGNGHADAVDPRLRGADGHPQRQHRDQRADRSPRHGPDCRAHAGARAPRDQAAPAHDGHGGGAPRRRERLDAGRAGAAAQGDERRNADRRSSC